MPTRHLLALMGVVAVAALVVQPRGVVAQENPVSLDTEKGTRDGSPVDDLPPHIRLLDIQLPDGGKPMRPDWSPDGRRLVFLDGPIGDLWEHDLATGTNRNLTEAFLPGLVLRAHHLTNGDVVLCAPAERSADDPEGDRFRGQLWVLQQPLGTRAPVLLGENCWEGVAVSRQPGSTRIAWNQSTINFAAFPDVFVEALIGESRVLTGRIVYGHDGVPAIAERAVVLDKRDVSPDTPAVEAQDFRTLADGDGDPDDELIFTAYFHKGGHALGLDLDSGAITDFAPASPYYEEAEGIDPAGRYVLVERDLTITLFPGMLDIWRLPLDGSGAFERLTTFDHYRGYGANNPVVSPDGTLMAFSLKVEGEEGEGDGILLMDLTASTGNPTAPSVASGAGVHGPRVDAAAERAPLAATGSRTLVLPAAVLVALGMLLGHRAAGSARRVAEEG